MDPSWKYAFLIASMFLENILAQYRCDSDIIDTSYKKTYEMNELFPYYIAGFDFDNLPVLVIEKGHWHCLFVSQNPEMYQEKVNEFRNEFFVCLEKLSNLTIPLSDGDYFNPGEFAVIFDLDGFNLDDFSTSASSSLLLSFWKGYKTFDNNIAYAFYINMNAVAENLALLTRPLMSKAFGRSQQFGTRKQSWIPALQSKIPKNILPPWYCGDNDCNNIRGIVSKSRDGRKFEEWRGIPYAKPPIGHLRFASPQAYGKWENIRDGSKFGPVCPGIGTFNDQVGDEDCLYLNVAAPKVNTTKLLPVIVFIHGGGFQIGCGSVYRPDYFMDENVIVVTLNYRLGILGFLSTGDAVIRGNMGLKDQVLALRWIKDNIQCFGGNPKRITVFGQSAGYRRSKMGIISAASAHHLMLSPSTKGLFQRAISQSGVASQSWAVATTEVAVKFTRGLARRFGCPTEDSLRIAECLRSKSVEELLEEYKNERGPSHGPQDEIHLFIPSIEAVDDDEAFLVEHPLEILAEGKGQNVPWMVGVNSDEGLIASMYFYHFRQKLESYEANWDTLILWTFGIPKDIPNAQELAKKIRNIYFPKNHELKLDQKLEQFTKLFSDAYFNLHLSHSISKQRKFPPVYPYYFSRRGGSSFTAFLDMIMKRPKLVTKLVKFSEVFFSGEDFQRAKEFENLLSVLTTTLYYKATGNEPTDHGVCHCDDLAMLFAIDKLCYIRKDLSCPDYNFSKDMVKLWADFAANEGTPLKFKGAIFPPLSPTRSLHYFEIGEWPKIIKEPFKSRIDALKSLCFVESQM